MDSPLKALMLGVVVLALQSGCKREPSFDERYREATKGIVEKAKSIDADIQATDAPVSAE